MSLSFNNYVFTGQQLMTLAGVFMIVCLGAMILSGIVACHIVDSINKAFESQQRLLLMRLEGPPLPTGTLMLPDSFKKL